MCKKNSCSILICSIVLIVTVFANQSEMLAQSGRVSKQPVVTSLKTPPTQEFILNLGTPSQDPPDVVFRKLGSNGTVRSGIYATRESPDAQQVTPAGIVLNSRIEPVSVPYFREGRLYTHLRFIVITDPQALGLLRNDESGYFTERRFNVVRLYWRF
ncbi:MAG TPA: hypothetical protein VFC63_00035 [Blastocatellia bacterium]|nr:hypothetical protein [Blastocatellia bacterium]